MSLALSGALGSFYKVVSPIVRVSQRDSGTIRRRLIRLIPQA